MKKIKLTLILTACFLCCFTTYAQPDRINKNKDSINNTLLHDYNNRIAEIEDQRKADSIKKAELENQLKTLTTTDNLKKAELLGQLQQIKVQEQNRIAEKKARIDSLKINATGYPVTGVLNDTLFYIYAKIGATKPDERARNISARILRLNENYLLKVDSITTADAEYAVDIVYGETIIMSISEADAMWQNSDSHLLAKKYVDIIKQDLIQAKEETRLSKLLIRMGLVLLVLLSVWMMFWLIGKGNKRLLAFFELNKKNLLKNLAYKDYTFLTEDQELQVILFILKILRWFVYALLLYIALPLIFSIFPFTRGWADVLFNLIWSPLKGIFISIWDYLPNLFSILVIYFVMKYFIRLVRYIFSEIEAEKLVISGFHTDWAMPTFSIIKFLLYAFMFVLIFPHLPGSDSNIFKGVSVFIGILFSLGSSTAIANMVAGLVITYMRPFKIGDRIKIGDVSGDVLEKTLLVTRIRTVKNEIVTIPNSFVLSVNTTNYSSEANAEGLIIHTTVTIGYDVPWKDMHQALIDAALRTASVLVKPKPFVLQTSLDDFYVSYQINAYTKEANNQAGVYSELHQNIQDVCNERGIEILSPHYRAERDGNMTSIPANYLSKDYKAPGFNIKIDNDK